MKILIFGGSGMLGHRLWMHVNRSHDAWVTVRGSSSQLPDVPEFPKNRICPHVDCNNYDDVIRTIGYVRPDIVVNCIGIIKQSPQANDPAISIAVNSFWPHRLASVCRASGARLIHISTDCVFSGRRGGYRESDISDAEDLYGRSKFLGEVDYPHAVTIRTSIIGRELGSRIGLIEWFLSQKVSIKGFKNAIFTGFTTDELSRVILDFVVPRTELHGLWQVSSDPISKYDLLQLAKSAYGLDVTILEDNDIIYDRSLDSSRFQSATDYQAPSWENMIAEMATNDAFYKRLNTTLP